MLTNLRFRDNQVFFGNRALMIAGFRILRSVGEGANGLVVEADDLTLRRSVAVKFWDQARTPENISRALEEMRKLAAVSHPSIVVVHQVGELDGVPYAIMELVPGQTAQKWLEDPRLTVQDRYKLWKKYIEALLAIYATGNVHGDPHTNNVSCLPSTSQWKILS